MSASSTLDDIQSAIAARSQGNRPIQADGVRLLDAVRSNRAVIWQTDIGVMAGDTAAAANESATAADEIDDDAVAVVDTDADTVAVAVGDINTETNGDVNVSTTAEINNAAKFGERVAVFGNCEVRRGIITYEQLILLIRCDLVKTIEPDDVADIRTLENQTR
ncbi:MAG: hypothetical protein IPK83_20855 [Planctomycetes bacterium]|nr:hypothetical protein [Planctomycetota bacterium]